MKKKKRMMMISLILAGVLVFCWLQNNLLVVSEYVYQSAKVPSAFEGYSIVQISDLHNATFGKGNKRLLDKVAELSPDMVVLTGDLIDSGHTHIPVAIEFARQLAENYPTYYVTGNHEMWLEAGERQELLEGLINAGVICLSDTYTQIERGDSRITLIGLNDESLSGVKLDVLLKKMEESGGDSVSPEEGDKRQEISELTVSTLQILLAHEPQYMENYSRCGMDLVFSGHAHGGQFRLPFLGRGLVAPGQGLFPRYTEGVHERNGTTMIISRGLGNSVIPVRLFNQPEIVCVKLVRENNGF